MRVLHLTTQYPWPPVSGGSVRTISQLRILASLSEVESVTVLSVAETPIGEEDVRSLEAAIPKLRVLPPLFHPIHLFDFKRYVLRVAALRIVRSIPYLAGKWESETLRRALRRELSGGSVSVVYVDHLGMATYFADIEAACPSCRIVLDQHNVESDFFKQYAARQRGVKKIFAEAEHRVSTRFEHDALQRADAVVAISVDDAKCFAELAGVSAYIVPMVLPFVRTERPRTERPNFCYVGNLRWHPNVAGLDWFCREVWPRIRARVPDATLEIAGVGLKVDASGMQSIPDAWKVPGVTTVGFLEDLEPLYRRSLAMIAPVFGGSGVRVKMLEGFRAGMPVVTTPDGASGLPLVDGQEALIGTDAEGFASSVERFVVDEDLRQHVRECGYRYLEKHHSLSAAQQVIRGALGCG